MTDKKLIAEARYTADIVDDDSPSYSSLLMALANALAAHQWRTDMENAPRDGTYILCWGHGHGHRGDVLHWTPRRWTTVDGDFWDEKFQPTHWRPLTPPEK